MDPVTAFAACQSAYAAIKAGISVGKELVEIGGHLGKFFDGVAAIRGAESKAKNPPLFKKLVAGGSVEKEALELTLQRQKLLEQEKELRSMLVLRFGKEVYLDMMRMREKLATERRRAEHLQQERRKALFLNLTFAVLIGGMLYGIWLLIWLAVEMAGGTPA
jgi:hypothetical protein